jgi:hypothetical protein
MLLNWGIADTKQWILVLVSRGDFFIFIYEHIFQDWSSKYGATIISDAAVGEQRA